MDAYIDVFPARPAIAAAADRANVALDLHDWLRVHITLGENAANGRAHMHARAYHDMPVASESRGPRSAVRNAAATAFSLGHHDGALQAPCSPHVQRSSTHGYL